MQARRLCPFPLNPPAGALASRPAQPPFALPRPAPTTALPLRTPLPGSSAADVPRRRRARRRPRGGGHPGHPPPLRADRAGPHDVLLPLRRPGGPGAHPPVPPAVRLARHDVPGAPVRRGGGRAPQLLPRRELLLLLRRDVPLPHAAQAPGGHPVACGPPARRRRRGAPRFMFGPLITAWRPTTALSRPATSPGSSAPPFHSPPPSRRSSPASTARSSAPRSTRTSPPSQPPAPSGRPWRATCPPFPPPSLPSPPTSFIRSGAASPSALPSPPLHRWTLNSIPWRPPSPASPRSASPPRPCSSASPSMASFSPRTACCSATAGSPATPSPRPRSSRAGGAATRFTTTSPSPRTTASTSRRAAAAPPPPASAAPLLRPRSLARSPLSPAPPALPADAASCLPQPADGGLLRAQTAPLLRWAVRPAFRPQHVRVLPPALRRGAAQALCTCFPPFTLSPPSRSRSLLAPHPTRPSVFFLRPQRTRSRT